MILVNLQIYYILELSYACIQAIAELQRQRDIDIDIDIQWEDEWERVFVVKNINGTCTDRVTSLGTISLLMISDTEYKPPQTSTILLHNHTCSVSV